MAATSSGYVCSGFRLAETANPNYLFKEILFSMEINHFCFKKCKNAEVLWRNKYKIISMNCIYLTRELFSYVSWFRIVIKKYAQNAFLNLNYCSFFM